MTITVIYRADAGGNDAFSSVDYGFKIFAASHLDVRVKDSIGVETTLTYPTHYSVTGVGRASGGTVALAAVGGAWQNVDGTLKTGYSIAIRRVVPVLQGTDVRNQGDFFPSVHEDAFDYITMIEQQHEDALRRSVILQPSYNPANFDMELPAPIAGAALGWNSSANGLANLVSLVGVSASAYILTLLDDANAAAARATLGLGSASVLNSGDVVLQSLADAAGDIIVATADNAFGKLPAVATVAAHATTMNPWSAREVVLSGSAVTFTDIADAPYAGAVVWVKQNAAHVWTNNSNLVVQGAQNFTAAAGDWVRIFATTVATFEVTIFKLSGLATLQPNRVYAEYTSAAAITASIPSDDTIPQITEGTEIILTSALVTRFAGGRFRVRFQGFCGAGNAGAGIFAAIFRIGVNDAISAAKVDDENTAGWGTQIVAEREIAHGLAVGTSCTFSVRVGVSAGNLWFNSDGSGNHRFGAASAATLVVEELP